MEGPETPTSNQLYLLRCTIKLLIIAFSLMVMSCATTKAIKTDQYSQITMDNIKQNCEPVQSWRIGVMGLMAYVYKFDNCLNVKTLLSVSVDVKSFTEEVRQNSVKLLMSHYLAYLESIEVEVDGIKRVFSIKKIKEEIVDTWRTHFFSLSYKKIKCSDKTCKEAE